MRASVPPRLCPCPVNAVLEEKFIDRFTTTPLEPTDIAWETGGAEKDGVGEVMEDEGDGGNRLAPRTCRSIPGATW